MAGKCRMDFKILEPVQKVPDPAPNPLMKITFLLFVFFGILSWGKAQECPPFVSDTMSVPGSGKVTSGDYLETTLKNQTVVRLMKTADGKFFLRLVITENFYFDKISTLEIRSGSKSYWVKNAKQYKIDKNHGLYIAEIYRNYVGTLRDHGITGIEFGGAYTDFSKSDAAQVKHMAGCMYASLDQKRQKHE